MPKHDIPGAEKQPIRLLLVGGIANRKVILTAVLLFAVTTAGTLYNWVVGREVMLKPHAHQQSRDPARESDVIQADDTGGGDPVWGVVNREPIDEGSPKTLTDPPSKLVTTTVQPTDSPPKVVIMAFYRGGSSLFGDIFNKDKRAMYLYEPLGGLLENNKTRQKEYNFGGHDPFTYSSNETAVPFPDDLVALLIKSVVQLLNCDFYQVDKDILRHYFMTEWTFTASTLAYRQCVIDNGNGSKGNDISEAVVNQCIPKLLESCKTAKIRSLKTIRMGLYEAERLIQKDPSILVIYYPRDPRSQMQSALERAPKSAWEATLVTRLCDRMRNDLSYVEPLKEKYPNNILVIRYEDIVLDPQMFTTTVYTKIGLQVPGNVDEFIQKAVKNRHGFVENWRKNITEEASELYLKKCSDIFDAFKYTKSMLPPLVTTKLPMNLADKNATVH